MSDEDHGFDVDSFNIDDLVIVYFKELVAGGAVVAKNRRGNTVTVVLESKVPTKVVVDMRAVHVVPVDDVDCDDDE